MSAAMVYRQVAAHPDYAGLRVEQEAAWAAQREADDYDALVAATVRLVDAGAAITRIYDTVLGRNDP